MAAGKRTRFALVFNGVRVPAMGGDFLKELDVIKAEGCEHDGKQFVVFTTRRPRKASDVLSAISAFNATSEEKMQLKMMRAEEAIKKHQANKSKIEKEIQAQKITKALFDDAKNFDAAQEREKIKAALVLEL